MTDDINIMTHANVDGAWVRVPDEDEAALVRMQVYKASYSSASGWPN